MLLVKLVSPKDETLGPGKASLQRVCEQQARVAIKQQVSPRNTRQCLELCSVATSGRRVLLAARG